MTDNDVEKWIETDPVTVALKTGDSKLADRIDILQRSRYKLPSYYNVRAEFSRISLEQSTSEVVASSRIYSGGDLAVDLTAGLGVDSLYLSKHYKKVISVEIDKIKSEQAALNFSKLAISNIDSVNISAEDFLLSFNGVADIIFVDPARRDDSGNRIYDISKTKPNVIQLLPLILSKTKELVIKCSPMFDIDELVKTIGHNCSVETISLDGECKELVVRISDSAPRYYITILSTLAKPLRYSFNQIKLLNEIALSIDKFKYLLCFDVAFIKSRTMNHFMSSFYPDAYYFISGSYVLSSVEIVEPVLRCYKILSVEPFKISILRKKYKGKKVSVLRKGFPISINVLKKQLSFIEGDDNKIALIMINGEKYTLNLE